MIYMKCLVLFSLKNRMSSATVLLCLKNSYSVMGKFSRRPIDDIFFIFPRKQNLTFPAKLFQRRQFA